MNFLKKIFMIMLVIPTVGWAWPTKDITIIVPWPPGGMGDQIARPLAADLQKQFNKPVIVKHVTGGNHAVALNSVINTQDDHTFVMIDTGYTSSLVSTHPDLVEKFRPTLIVGGVPIMLSGSKNVSVQHLQQAMRNGQSIMVGNTGADLPHYLWIKGLTKRPPIESVSYKGGTPAMVDLAGGHIDYAVMSMTLTMQHAENGKIKPLAIASHQRHPAAPDVPTYEEIGLQGAPGEIWWGIVSHRQTSNEAIAIFGRTAAEILKTNSSIQRLSTQGLTIAPQADKLAEKFIQDEVEKFRRIK